MDITIVGHYHHYSSESELHVELLLLHLGYLHGGTFNQ